MQEAPRPRPPAIDPAEPIDVDPVESVEPNIPDPSVLPEPVDAEDREPGTDVERA
jgi:hypothetical protein